MSYPSSKLHSRLNQSIKECFRSILLMDSVNSVFRMWFTHLNCFSVCPSEGFREAPNSLVYPGPTEFFVSAAE